MCVLCGEFVKYSCHLAESLKIGSIDGIGPSSSVLGKVTKDDVYYLSPKGESFKGKQVQASWYKDPLNDMGKAITISYSFATNTMLQDSSYRVSKFFGSASKVIEGKGESFSATQQDVVRKIFEYIETFTNITFEEVTGLDADRGGAKIQFAQAKLSVSGVAGLPSVGDGDDTSGIVYVNKQPEVNYSPGGHMYQTLLHEIGHALGLKHPHNEGGTEDSVSMGVDDIRLSGTNTLMSYRFLSVTYFFPLKGGGSSRSVSSYQHLDILSLQSIYGEGDEFRDDTVHDFIDSINSIETINGLQEVVFDNGGIDTIKGYSTKPNRIDLRSEYYSDIGYGYMWWLPRVDGLNDSLGEGNFFGLRSIERIYKGENNVLISEGSEIENAEGGSESDDILGNHLYNELKGEGGDDRIRGGEGSDLLQGGEGGDTLEGGSGGDRLEGGSGASDTVRYSESISGVRVSLAEGFADDGYSRWRDEISGVENVIGSAHDDILVGDGSGNVLVGGGGSDKILGGAGDDIIDGNANDIGVSWGIDVVDLESQLPTVDRDISAMWGSNFAVEGNILVVGDSDKDRIDIFTRTSSTGAWEWQQKVVGDEGSGYGKSIDILGDVIIVGAPSAGNKRFEVVGRENSFADYKDDIHVFKVSGDSIAKLKREIPPTVSATSNTGYDMNLYYVGSDIKLISRDSSGFSNQTVKFSQSGDVFWLEGDSYNLRTTKILGILGNDKHILAKMLFNSNLLIQQMDKSSLASSTAISSGFVVLSKLGGSAYLKNFENMVLFGDLFASTTDPDKSKLSSLSASAKSDIWDRSSGLVEVWRHDGSRWQQEAFLLDDSDTDDKFGASLAFGEVGGAEFLAVGAPREDNAAGQGKVYVYQKQGEKGWILQGIIKSPEVGIKGFGKSVKFADDGGLLIDSDDGFYSYGFESYTSRFLLGSSADVVGDRLFGGAGDDVLVGGEGADVIDGGAGNDRVVFRGALSDYNIDITGDIIKVDKGGVVDRLYNIETLIFADQEKSITYPTKTDNIAPTLDKSHSVTYDSITVGVTSNELGYGYVLLLGADKDVPSHGEILILGKEESLSLNTKVNFNFSDLLSGEEYKAHILIEDVHGNRTYEAIDIDTSKSIVSGARVSQVGGDVYKLEVETMGKSKVYYTYMSDGLDKPTASELQAGPSGAYSYGSIFVDEAKSDESGKYHDDIYFLKQGGGVFYLMAGDEKIRATKVLPSYQDEYTIGLSVIGVSDSSDF